MDRIDFVRAAASLAVLLVLAPAPAHAGGLSFVEFQQANSVVTHGLRGARDVVVEDNNVYAIGDQDNAISVWQREATTNALTFIEVEEDGVGGVDGLKNPTAVAASLDGACVYVATEDNPPGPGTGTVVVFNRTVFGGGLTFVEVKEDDVAGVAGIGNASALAISVDGKSVYVAGERDDAIAIFSRTPPGCVLTFVGVVKNGIGGVAGLARPQGVAVSPDGGSVYATARLDVLNDTFGTVVAFDRDATTGALTFLAVAQDGVAGVEHLMPPVSAITVSGFGDNVYATTQAGDAVVAFSRDPGTGLLTFLETERRSGFVRGIKGASGIATSPFDDYVYVTGRGDNALAVFKRDPATGALDFLEVHGDPVPGTNVLGSVEAVAAALDFSGGVFAVASGPDTLVAFTADRCGDGHLGVDEQCDDGCLAGVANYCEPVDDGDGCSSSCRLELCGPVPSGACHAATPLGGASLQIKDFSDDHRDQLKWNWKGEATPIAEFGDPVTTASYVVCVYDGSGNSQPLLSRAAPVGGICAGKPCWMAKPRSYEYSDKLLTPNGVKRTRLTEGLVDGKPKVQVQAVGIFVDPPALPLTLPVTVQVKNTQNSECWQAVYTVADKNDAGRFQAKSD